MAQFYTDLFTPETWAAFRAHGAAVSGFRESQRRAAERVQVGDVLVCYVVRLSRWCGLLRVESPVYLDNSPIFDNPDPYVLRFKVDVIVALDLEHSIPIYEEAVWQNLSLTQGMDNRAFGWAQAANLRSSLRVLSDPDSEFLDALLRRQHIEQREYVFSPEDQRRLKQRASIRTADRAVVVDVPQDETEPHEPETESEGPRQSHRVQASLARIGIEMGFKVWIPRADRQAILALVPADLHTSFLDLLPLNYDDTTLKTVEQIDVLWLQGRSMARAFEVEHTTAIYSGLLRMADLLALQPNMDIRLHIVAPSEKREKVLREIVRPVFSLLDRGPLYEHCSYVSYESVDEIARMKFLTHMSDSIVEEYEEYAQDE